MSDGDVRERLARVEERLNSYEARVEERRAWEGRMEEKFDAIEEDLARYRGGVGAVLIVVTSVGTAIKFFWEDILRFFTGK